MDFQRDIDNAKASFEIIKENLPRRGCTFDYRVPYGYLQVRPSSYAVTSGTIFRRKTYHRSYFASITKDGSYSAYEINLRWLCGEENIRFYSVIVDPDSGKMYAPPSTSTYGNRQPELHLICTKK